MLIEKGCAMYNPFFLCLWDNLGLIFLESLKAWVHKFLEFD